MRLRARDDRLCSSLVFTDDDHGTIRCQHRRARFTDRRPEAYDSVLAELGIGRAVGTELLRRLAQKQKASISTQKQLRRSRNDLALGCHHTVAAAKFRIERSIRPQVDDEVRAVGVRLAVVNGSRQQKMTVRECDHRCPIDLRIPSRRDNQRSAGTERGINLSIRKQPKKRASIEHDDLLVREKQRVVNRTDPRRRVEPPVIAERMIQPTVRQIAPENGDDNPSVPEAYPAASIFPSGSRNICAHHRKEQPT